jgi:hypothetical protein
MSDQTSKNDQGKPNDSMDELTPTKPANDTGESVTQDQPATGISNGPPEQPPVILNIPPSPPEDSNADRRKDHTPTWKIIVETVALILAAGLFILNILQTLTTRDAVNLTREQVHIGQRAYLYMHNGVLDYPPKVGEGLHATFDLTNNGQTPAKDIYYSFYFDISEGIPPVTARYVPASPIPAGECLKLSALLLNKLTDSDLKIITANNMPSLDGNTLNKPIGPRLYLRIFTKYKDVFGGEGLTEFCGIYDASMNRFLGCADHIVIMK